MYGRASGPVRVSHTVSPCERHTKRRMGRREAGGASRSLAELGSNESMLCCCCCTVLPGLRGLWSMGSYRSTIDDQ